MPFESTCGACGVAFKKPGLRAHKHCSRACYLSSKRPARMTGKTVACAQCGAGVYIEAGRLKRGSANNFCGVACREAHQAKAKVERACTICGTKFRLSPSTAARTAGRYCSITCRNACGSWKSNAVIAGNLKQLNAKGLNRLELAGRTILQELGIAFEEQVLIDGKFVVDVRLQDRPVVIQWDGDYWHGYRAAGDTRPLDVRQDKRATFDRSQDAYMQSVGLTVLRYWEHQITSARDEVAASILAALAPP